MNTPERAWDAWDVAAFLGVHVVTVRRWAAQGKLPAKKIGSRLIFDPNKIRALL